MLTRDLDFDLPPELIAQTPVEPRDAARLMVLQRTTGSIAHHHVRDLPQLLHPGDLLVFNDTRVLRARLRGHKPSGGKVEALLLKEQAFNRWEALLKPSARLQVGSEVTFSRDEGTVTARLLERHNETWSLEFLLPGGGDVRDLLSQLGEVPLPPYIHEQADEARYQTVYSRVKDEGARLDSAAAPTAGLHFTPELLEQLRGLGIETAFVTLAVGVGTFRPVQAERLEDHPMHAEEFWISDETARRINEHKARGGRVVAVGTTTVRALESSAGAGQGVVPGDASTQLFLRPGSPFRVVDALLTNFHLPRSTLLSLVAAFVQVGLNSESFDTQTDDSRINGENGSTMFSTGSYGLECMRAAYRVAIESRYRFFSFGDAMFIE